MAEPRRDAAPLKSGPPDEILASSDRRGYEELPEQLYDEGDSDSGDEVTVRNGAARHFAARERERQRRAAAFQLRRDGSASSSDDDRGSRGAASSRTHPERPKESEAESAAGESAVRSAQSRATEDEARRHRAQSERRIEGETSDSSEIKSRAHRNGGGRERGVRDSERLLGQSEGESSSSAGDLTRRAAAGFPTVIEARRRRARDRSRSDSGSGDSCENERRAGRIGGGRERGVSRSEQRLGSGEKSRETLTEVGGGARRAAASRQAEAEARRRRARGERRSEGSSGDSSKNESRACRNGGGRERGVSSSERPVRRGGGETTNGDCGGGSESEASLAPRRDESARFRDDMARRRRREQDHRVSDGDDERDEVAARARSRSRSRAEQRAEMSSDPSGRVFEEGNERGRHHLRTQIHNFDPRPPVPAAGSSSLSEARHWLAASDSKLSQEQLHRMTIEMSLFNQERWSESTRKLANTAGEGETRSLVETLQRLNLTAVVRSATYTPFESSEAERWDPLNPDFSSLERSGVNKRSRDGQERRYAPGSLPKVQTAVNRWCQFSHDHAHVTCLRPRVHRSQPEQFMKECYLKMSFVAWCTLTGCSVATAEGYMSLIQSWHIDQVGYRIAESEVFTDHQFSRTNRGLRRLLPHKSRNRIAHPTQLNEQVLRASLKPVFEVYDSGPLDAARLNQIRILLQGTQERFWSGSFDKALYDDLFYSALTEFMTDGLLRPSESLPNMKDPVTGAKIRSLIHRDDIKFSFRRDGVLHKVEVMITPIKQSGSRIGSLDKVPIPILAGRGGTLRSAELLHIITSLDPVARGQEATTPLFRYCRERVRMPESTRKHHQWISHQRVMNWYQSHCRAADIPNAQFVKMHSFRIGGATAMLAAGISAEEIKIRGRWASGVYEIYCRVCESRLLEISSKMSNVNTDVFIGRGEGFFNMAAGTTHDDDGNDGAEVEGDGDGDIGVAVEDPYSNMEIYDYDDDDSDYEPNSV